MLATSGPNPLTIFSSSEYIFWGNGSNVTSSGGAISSITNLFGGPNLVQASDIAMPALTAAALNGYPSITFDTVDRVISNSGFTINTNVYVAAVINVTSYASGFYNRYIACVKAGANDYDNADSCALILEDAANSKITGFYNNIAYPGTSVAQAAGTYFTLEYYWDFAGLTQTIYQNEGLKSTVAIPAGPINSTVLAWGGYSAACLLNRTVELIVTKSSSATQRTQTQAYLKTKYNHY